MVIVVTGGSSGIGEAIGKILVERNNIVYSLSRNPKESKNSNLHFFKCDVTKKDEIEKAFEKIYLENGQIDVLINNAGIGISGAVEYQTLEEIKSIIDVNVIGVINTTQIAINYLRKSKGKIINIGSVAGEVTIPFQTLYSMTKASIHAFSEGLANEVKPFSISVSCVMPGDTKTSFTKNRKKNIINEHYGKRIEKSLMKMEKDEENGVSAEKVAKVVLKIINKKKPPLKVAVGFDYKFFLLLKKILPNRFIQYILYKMYGGN